MRSTLLYILIVITLIGCRARTDTGRGTPQEGGDERKGDFSTALAGHAPAPDNTRTYQFTARIKANAGITPFKVGDLITGTFTYDLDANDQIPKEPRHGSYKSPRNTLSFQLGDLRFSGVGDITVTTALWKHADHFGIVAHDLKLPEGWEMDHTGRSDSYGFLLQNAPAKGAVPDDGIPKHVKLSDFSSTREFRLDFFHGVRFPGGQVHGRATVFAVVESLEEMHR